MGAPPETLVRETPLGSERRQVRDRRVGPTTLLGALRPGGRRRGFRRSGEGRDRYVDRLDAVTVFLSLIVLVASVLDAILTLRHLQNGGWELNPLMHAVLECGVPFFVGAKILATGIGVVFLAIHQNFALGRLTLRLAALVYVALLGYHAFLLVV
jgi:hypothetical protein